jgi:seryl-tRNA synthetase
MIDINHIRNNPDAFRQAVKVKRIPADVDALLAVDQQRRQLQHRVEELRHQRNKLSSETKGVAAPARQAHLLQCKQVTDELELEEQQLATFNSEFNRLILFMPSIPDAEVPQGESDDDNLEVKRWGLPPDFGFPPKDHMELAQLHKMVELDACRQFAGSRAYALTGDGALLELAVLRFALERVVEKGFVPVVPPVMVRAQAMLGTGYFPLGEEDAYRIDKDGLYLPGTSEVPLIAMHGERTYPIGDLPLKFAGISTCFRREAGAAGKDTRGLYRVHQFQKIEQIVIAPDDDAQTRQIHFQLLQNAEEILQALELPYRVVAVCTGELGLGQVRKHDVEAWMPSRQSYGETHSCSTLGEFQARRLNIRFTAACGGKRFVHTLNNTAIASPRILIPLLENHQREDGSINVPPALRPYLNGRDRLIPG